MATIGGRLIDQGTSGCVFSPPLHCKYKKDNPKIYKIYGTRLSINAGNMLYYNPVKIIMNNKKYDNKIRI